MRERPVLSFFKESFMFGLLAPFWARAPRARRPVSSSPRPRCRPVVESLECRAVPATTSVALFGAPNPGVPGTLVSFPVTITGNLGPNDTDIQGNATVVDTTTGYQLSSVPMIFVGGTPNSIVKYQFTASGTFAAGNHTIVATFNSTDPSTPGSSASVVETIKEPTVIVMPPHRTVVIGVHRHKHIVTETLEVFGTSKIAVHGHFYLAVEHLNPKIILVNAKGFTVNETPLGTPYVKLTATSISKTHPAKVTLVFDDPFPGNPSFKPVLLQTDGTP
jgi:hypothetical protein